jgi:hypothetical protein
LHWSEERFLTAQADTFAGSEREGKGVGRHGRTLKDIFQIVIMVLVEPADSEEFLRTRRVGESAAEAAGSTKAGKITVAAPAAQTDGTIPFDQCA